uniref:BMA-CYP-43A1 n=1 Tax=Brugia malayi TaxID=6279 RepID=A0A0H5S6T0_BRUMA|nr:BMA-CYP-43A1 [Brugia malayi]
MKRFFASLRSAIAQLDQDYSGSHRTAKIDDAERVAIDSSALHCPVCFCVFASAPFILKCGHSFCQNCIKNIVENSYSEQIFECPMCRQVISSEIRFTRNYIVDALLQSVCEIAENENESSVDPNLRISFQLISGKFLEEQKKNKILQKKYEEERIRSRRYLILLVMESALYRKAWDIIRDCGFPVVPSQHWLFGSLDIMKSYSTHWQLGKLTRKYGRTYGIMQGSHPTVVTSDPKIIYEICFKQFRLFHSRIMDPSSSHPDTVYEVHEFAARGERWKRIRSLTSKAVSNENLRKLFHVMCDSVNCFVKDLEEEITDSKALELHPRFQTLTFDIISRCCMGRPYSYQHNDSNLKLLLKKFSPLQRCVPDLKWISLTYAKLCLRFRITFHLEIDPLVTYTNYLRKLISMDITSQDRSSFLYFMKCVEDDEWDDWIVDADKPYDISSMKIIPKLTTGEIINQCRFLTTAGFDTTANTVAYLIYLLASNSEKQEKLYQEIATLEITFDNVQHFNYLHYTIMETLRLFPHASLLQSRMCVQQCEIGPYTFKKDVGVIFDTWSLHYDQEIWGSDVKQFRPDRFLDYTTIQKRNWMAFGAGPRQCVGMRFAMLEIKIIICSLLKKFCFRKIENTCKIAYNKPSRMEHRTIIDLKKS